MDIKLKNRHKISALLALLIVVTAALIMVGLYPFFEKESARYEEPVYEDQGFLRHLVFGNYVLALEQAQYEQGSMISPFQYFFPRADEELQSEITGRVSVTGSPAGEIQDGHSGFGSQGGEASPEEDAQGDSPKDQVSAESVPQQQPYNDPDAIEYVVTYSEQQGYEDRENRMEYIRQLRQDMVEEYGKWNRYFGSIRNAIDYQVLDESGKVLTDHAAGRSILESDEYVFKAVLHYDELGRMDVASVKGDDSASSILNILREFGDTDPMDNSYWTEYLYEPGFTLENPKNMTFAYGMTARQMADFAENRGSYWSSYYNSGSVSQVFFGLVCAVAVLAFLLSFLDVTWPEHNKLFRAPLELIFISGTSAIAFGTGLTSLVAATNRGDLYAALIRADFRPQAAEVMIWLWNVLWWSLAFGVIYWCILCIKDVFYIGLKRYVKERTLTGRLWCWLKKTGRRFYRFVSDIDLQERSERIIFRIVGANFIILAVLCSLWFFGIGALFIYSAVLFIVMRRFYKDLSDKYKILLKATNQIAEGNLDVSIEDELGVFEPFKKEIQKIQSGFKVAVDEEVKSQKLKTDLISNMSHDLKTPLTAIITYVNLLKEENTTPEQRKAYTDILEQKSMRLKSLIEDLFEISKANSNNVTLNLAEVDIVSLLKEVSLELSDKIEESTIDFRWNLPDEKIVLPLDSQKTYRIFDNLLTNIIKYAMPHTRAYVDMKMEGDYVVISLKNISAAELNFNADEITERFARGDKSRNTEGSGLGLAIAKSFAELQKGKLSVEVEADLFRVTIRWLVS